MERKAVSDEHCIERLDVSVYTIPTDAPKTETARSLGIPRASSWSSPTPAVARSGWAKYGDTATGTLVRDLLAGVVVGRDVRDTRRRVGGDGRKHSQPRPPGDLLDGHRRRRHRALGHQGTMRRPATVPTARRGAGRGPGLRQRRLYHLHRAAPRRTACRLGRRRHSACENEDRHRPRRIAAPRHRTRCRRSQCHRR